MNVASTADQRDPVQAAAYAIIDQIAPFFDLSDTESDTAEDSVEVLSCTISRSRLRGRSTASLSPIFPTVPFSIDSIFPQSDERDVEDAGGYTGHTLARVDAPPRTADPDLQRSSTLDCRTAHRATRSHQGRSHTAVTNASSLAMDSGHARSDIQHKRAPVPTTNSRRRDLPAALPTLSSHHLKSKITQPQQKETRKGESFGIRQHTR